MDSRGRAVHAQGMKAMTAKGSTFFLDMKEHKEVPRIEGKFG